MATPLLSIGMIVKNESRSLEKCLTALQPLRDAIPCELVIADTGSTDDTKEIAGRFADVLFDFPWVNDFAAARNAVMDRCSGAWYLSVDADEYLDSDISELVSFLKGKKQVEYVAAFLYVKNYNTRDFDEHTLGTLFRACRLFRVASGLRFTGSIHEHPDWSITKRGHTFLLNTILHHDGYASATQQEQEENLQKRQHYSEMLHAALEKTPDSINLLLQSIDAAPSPEQKLVFARKIFDWFQTHPEQTSQKMSPYYCRALFVLLEGNTMDAIEKLDFYLENFSPCIIFLTDVALAASTFFQHKNDYHAVFHYAKQYLEGFTRCQQNDIPPEELLVTTPTTYNHRSYQLVRFLEALSAAKTLPSTEIISFFEDFPREVFLANKHSLTGYLNMLAELSDFSDISDSSVIALSTAILSEVYSESPETSVPKDLQDAATNLFEQAQRSPKNQSVISLFTGLENSIGTSAKLLCAQSKDDVISALNSELAGVSDLALYQVIRYAIPLPTTCYAFTTDHRRRLLSIFSTQKGAAEALMKYRVCENFMQSITKQLFFLDFTTALLQEESLSFSQRDALCLLFVELSEALLPELYSSTVFSQEENWCALPNYQHFALLLLKGKQQAIQGDALGFVQTLGEGLQVAPAMKTVVEHLSDHGMRLFSLPSPELLTLASEVRKMLAQYPEDHPAAQSIRQSEAYRKLAHLIEAPTAEEELH